MNRLEFYKDMYFNEAEIKHKLEEKVSIPIGVLTIIISGTGYILLNEQIKEFPLTIIKYITFFMLIFVVKALFYISRSFINLGEKHTYKELASMNAFMKYDKELKAHQRDAEFEEHLEKELADCASHNRTVNIKRTKDMAEAKASVFYSFIFAFLNSLVYLITASMK